MNTKLILIVGLLVVLVGGFFALNSYIYNEKQADPQPVVIDSEPTDFAEVGTVTIDNPGGPEGVPVLVYEQPGAPALTRDLVFDELSVCMRERSATPCMAMSQTFSAAFGEQRVSVEGIETDEGLLVRKIRALRDGERALRVEPGSVFISWDQARSIIENCQAAQVTQTHALDVYITLDDGLSAQAGQRVRAVEPNIDDVFDVLETVQGSCPQIPVATE